VSDGIQHRSPDGTKAFCALRTDKCDPCGNEYRACDPGWEDFSFVQGRKLMVEKIFEAHHLLCIACVTDFIGKDAKIIDIVKQTAWCINAERNMLAMPLWGNTISHYCDVEDDGRFKKEDEVAHPPFGNIPQHDYDHNSKTGYTSEINTEMKQLAEEIAKIAKKNHEAAVKELTDKLGTLSDDYRKELKRRGGERSGGTHDAWYAGLKKPSGNWYKPFSMADDGNEEKRTFPIADDGEKMSNKLDRIVSAWKFWNP
jgi:hypothetical protein